MGEVTEIVCLKRPKREWGMKLKWIVGRWVLRIGGGWNWPGMMINDGLSYYQY
jgi:hypothetical protein